MRQRSLVGRTNSGLTTSLYLPRGDLERLREVMRWLQTDRIGATITLLVHAGLANWEDKRSAGTLPAPPIMAIEHRGRRPLPDMGQRLPDPRSYRQIARVRAAFWIRAESAKPTDLGAAAELKWREDRRDELFALEAWVHENNRRQKEGLPDLPYESRVDSDPAIGPRELVEIEKRLSAFSTVARARRSFEKILYMRGVDTAASTPEVQNYRDAWVRIDEAISRRTRTPSVAPPRDSVSPGRRRRG